MKFTDYVNQCLKNPEFKKYWDLYHENNKIEAESFDIEEAFEALRSLNEKEKLVYHGSKNKFNFFDIRKQGSASDFGTLGNGIYFTFSKALAKHYAGSGGYVYTCILDLKNPYIIDRKSKEQKLYDAQFDGVEELIDKLGIPKDDPNNDPTNNPMVRKLLHSNNDNFFKNYDGCIAYWSKIPEIILDNDEICVFDPSKIRVVNVEKV